MHVHPEIRGPLMTVGNYLGAANAYVIILTMIAFAIAEVFLLIVALVSVVPERASLGSRLANAKRYFREGGIHLLLLCLSLEIGETVGQFYFMKW